MYSVARNPLLPKAFVSVGDWTVRMWNEELRPSLSCSQYRPGYLQCGKWSTTRCGGLGCMAVGLHGSWLGLNGSGWLKR